MEKIITVKREPIDDAYPTPPSTKTASTTVSTATTTVPAQTLMTKTTPSASLGTATATSGVVTGTASATAATPAPGAVAPEHKIFYIQPKPELSKTQCTVVSVMQGTSGTTSSTKGVVANAHSKQPVVVISGSPIKLTPLSRAGASLGAVQASSSAGNNITCTLVHVQPLNAASKQNIAPKAGASPSKTSVPLQIQKLVPISVAASSLAKIQPGTTPQFTMAAAPTTSVRHIAPKVSIVSAVPGAHTVRLTTPSLQVRNIAPAEKPAQVPQLAPKPAVTLASSVAQQPRLIVPALPSNMSQLSGVTGATAAGNVQFPHGVLSGGVVYLPQQALASGGFPIAVPMQTNALATSAQTSMTVNGSSAESSPPSRPRKPCNCTKSQCLKLYCDCFANGEFCNNCNCVNCSNNMEREKERSKAIKACLDRNPHAFHPKIGKGKGDAERRHNKVSVGPCADVVHPYCTGCHCKRSGCLKNYCECYEAKILCTNLCKCTGCKNFEESPERKTLMHLADAAEVRVKQQNAARTKLESQIEDLPSRPTFLSNSGERLPFSFVTDDVVQATCQCLLAQASNAESEGRPQAMIEKIILEEFGRCLLSIIHTANGTKE